MKPFLVPSDTTIGREISVFLSHYYQFQVVKHELPAPNLLTPTPYRSGL